jgi:hypothetical protein
VPLLVDPTAEPVSSAHLCGMLQSLCLRVYALHALSLPALPARVVARAGRRRSKPEEQQNRAQHGPRRRRCHRAGAPPEAGCGQTRGGEPARACIMLILHSARILQCVCEYTHSYEY